MIRRVIAGAIAVAALVPLAASAPATADTTPTCQGTSCSADVSKFITAYGSGYSAGSTNHVPVNQEPPPCLWNEIGNQVTGSLYIINNFGDATPNSLFDVYNSVQQAKQLLANGGPAGTWYVLPVNPAAGPAGRAACLLLPLFAFAQPNQVPPMGRIPPEVFAEFAWNHMTLAAPRVTIRPANKGFVNLATFVWWRGLPRTMWVTAALLDRSQAATVVARVVGTPSISTSPAGAASIFQANCGADGSNHPLGSPPATGPGTAPDCGVLWTQPASGVTVTVTVTWQVVFHAGFSHAFFGQPVPGAPANGITTQGNSNAITVHEIQTVTGG